jgi:hypothetical protein
VLTSQPVFVHRINADGSIDSFCRKCLITVASSQWEAELERAENKHGCDPLQLEYVSGILNPPQEKGTETFAAKRGAPCP